MRKVSIIVHEPSPRDNLPDDDKDDATLQRLSDNSKHKLNERAQRVETLLLEPDMLFVHIRTQDFANLPFTGSHGYQGRLSKAIYLVIHTETK